LIKTRFLLAAGLAVIFGLFCNIASAREIWVVRFNTVPSEPDPPCQPVVTWHSNLMFHNTTAAPLEVRPLAVTGGSLPPNARALVVPAGATVSIRGRTDFDLHWEQEGFGLWVNRLDVPEGIVVSNRGETGISDPPPGPPPCGGIPAIYAGYPVPARSDLVAAGVPQYHLGVDTGGPTQGNDTGDARINVGLFNAGSLTADVTIQVRCSSASRIATSPDPNVVSFQISVEPNTIIQPSALASTLVAGCPTGIGVPSLWHVVVTSDQPGFSYAGGVANGTLPKLPVSMSLTQ
jgi:hypothetical protein